MVKKKARKESNQHCSTVRMLLCNPSRDYNVENVFLSCVTDIKIETSQNAYWSGFEENCAGYLPLNRHI